MFRLRITAEYQPDLGHHNTHLDQETFGRIACGERVLALGEAQDRVSIEDIYYSGVWNPDTSEFVNNLTPDQVPAAYIAFEREIYP